MGHLKGPLTKASEKETEEDAAKKQEEAATAEAKLLDASQKAKVTGPRSIFKRHDHRA